MAVYRTLKRLGGVEGKKTGKVYTCSRGHVIRAPEGEFDAEDAILEQPDAKPEATPSTAAQAKKTKEGK